MLLCHLRRLERCHPRLWIKQQQHQPDLWCGSVPMATPIDIASTDAAAAINPAGCGSSICWQWLSKFDSAQVRTRCMLLSSGQLRLFNKAGLSLAM
jgi:hypothetical protein